MSDDSLGQFVELTLADDIPRSMTDAPVGWIAGSVLLDIAPVAPTDRCEDVHARFLADKSLPALAVVEHDRPVGLVNRTHVLFEFSRPFIRDIYGRRPIADLMQAAPLTIDFNTGIETLGTQIARPGSTAFSSGFIITRKGRYAGVGTAVDVMRRMVARMAERNRALDVAVADAERANTAKTAFLANMSHELRTPLNAVIGFCEIMMQQLLGPIGQPRYREYVVDIHDSARHLLSLINELLDLAKLDAGRLELDLAETDLADIARQCLRMLESKAVDGGVTLTHDIDADMPCMVADPRRLRQIVLNLVSNAIKFTPSGGRVDIRCRADGADIVVIVRDTGVGMTEDEIAVAFSRFGQVDSQLSRRHEGTGLGLPLTKALVELHGGTLALASIKNEETVVTVSMPRSAASNPNAAMPAAQLG